MGHRHVVADGHVGVVDRSAAFERESSNRAALDGPVLGGGIRAHMIAIDSQNRMYTGEAGNGRRMQRWILKGTRAGASVKPPSAQ